MLQQRQECFGGCFSEYFDGYLANLRIWDKALSLDDMKDKIFATSLDNAALVMAYEFTKNGISQSGGAFYVKDMRGASSSSSHSLISVLTLV